MLDSSARGSTFQLVLYLVRDPFRTTWTRWWGCATMAWRVRSTSASSPPWQPVPSPSCCVPFPGPGDKLPASESPSACLAAPCPPLRVRLCLSVLHARCCTSAGNETMTTSTRRIRSTPGPGGWAPRTPTSPTCTASAATAAAWAARAASSRLRRPSPTPPCPTTCEPIGAKRVYIWRVPAAL